MTIGMVLVARIAGVRNATMTSGLSATSSAVTAGRAPGLSAAERISIWMFLPST